MVLPLTTILQLALRSLLAEKLQKSILLLRDKQNYEEQTFSKPISVRQTTHFLIEDVPLKLIKNSPRIEYRSAIAFKAAEIFEVPAQKLAQRIGVQLSALIKESDPLEPQLSLDRVWRQCAIVVIPPGWIQLELSESGVALWLQLLTTLYLATSDRLDECNRYGNDNHILSKTTNTFKIQYTHARCCSLLRLASREQLIELQERRWDAKEATPVVVAPNPIPWLTSEHRLWLQHPTEARLLMQLVSALDHLASLTLLKIVPSPELSFKQAIALSTAFHEFYAACPMYGNQAEETQTRKNQVEQPQVLPLELVQARLGLVSATQIMLNLLLNHGGLTAPTVL